MDYFQNQINEWSDWQAVQNTPTAFEPLLHQIYLSENEPFKTPEIVTDDFAAVFNIGPTQIAIFPPANVAANTRDRYQTERFSLTRMTRLQLTAPQLLHAGFIFDSYQFYYVIYRPLMGTPVAEFVETAEPLAKSTLGRQIGAVLAQLDGEVASFNQVNARALSDQADWLQLGANFAADRDAYLAAHPATPNCFVHSDLTGDNLVVTPGQVGLQHFQLAMQAPRQAELVPLVLRAFAWDADLLQGFRETYGVSDLASELLMGLLWRADGPAYIQHLMANQYPVTLAQVAARLQTILPVE